MSSKKKIALLFNSKAGKGKAVSVVKIAEQKLNALSISFESFDSQWPDELNTFSEVWLIGGDGTLNFFINKYQQLKIPVALFKGGSGNDFAWKLYGNISVETYLERALKNNVIKTDAGICNGKYFINGAGVGFDGETVRNMGAKRFISAGHIAYLIVVLKTIFNYREVKMKVTCNGKTFENKFLMINVANGSRYGGGFMVAPQAIVNDRMLDVILVDALSSLKRLINLPKIEKGKHLQLPFVRTATCQSIKIETSLPVAGQLDGELLIDSKFEIQILPEHFMFKI